MNTKNNLIFGIFFAAVFAFAIYKSVNENTMASQHTDRVDSNQAGIERMQSDASSLFKTSKKQMLRLRESE